MLCKACYSNTAGYEDVLFTTHPTWVNLGDVGIEEGFSTSNPFSKYMTSGSEQTVHSSKQEKKIAEGHKFPHCLQRNSDRNILLLFSFYQVPIHKNNLWKQNPAYCHLTPHYQVCGFLVCF